MGYAKVLRRQKIPNVKQQDGTKTGFFRCPCSFLCSSFLVTRSSLPVPRCSNTPQTQSSLLLLLIRVNAMKSLMRHRVMEILKKLNCPLYIVNTRSIRGCGFVFLWRHVLLRQQQFSRQFCFSFPTSSDFDNKVHMFIRNMPHAVSSR